MAIKRENDRQIRYVLSKLKKGPLSYTNLQRNKSLHSFGLFFKLYWCLQWLQSCPEAFYFELQFYLN